MTAFVGFVSSIAPCTASRLALAGTRDCRPRGSIRQSLSSMGGEPVEYEHGGRYAAFKAASRAAPRFGAGNKLKAGGIAGSILAVVLTASLVTFDGDSSATAPVEPAQTVDVVVAGDVGNADQEGSAPAAGTARGADSLAAELPVEAVAAPAPAEPVAVEPAPEPPAPEPVPAPIPVPVPEPAPVAPPVAAPEPPVEAPAPPPAPLVRTIYVAGAGGQALVDSCIGPIHYTPNDGYSLFITEHDYCGGWARFSGIGVGETVSLGGYGTYTVTARGQVPNPGTTNDVIAVFGGFPRAILQTCIPGTRQMLLIALN